MLQNDKIKEQPKIPQGWTYLVHGSNSARWSADALGKDFVVSRDLCCVTREDCEQDKRHGFRGTAYTYSSSSGTPFQIRVLFFKDIRYSSQAQLKSELSEDTIQDIKKCYSFQGGRHPAIPPKTKLIKIAQTDYDEVYDRLGQTIYWYVPEKYMGMYEQALKKEKQSDLQSHLKSNFLTRTTQFPQSTR